MAASVERRQCSFYLPLKKRYCRMQASRGSRYCGEHFDVDGRDASSSDRQRIRCPLDSSHTVFEDQLKKHLRRCNAAKQHTPSCLTTGINSGGLQGYRPPLEEKLSLSAIPRDKLESLTARLLAEIAPTLSPVPLRPRHHHVLQEEIDSTSNGKSARKHLLQQSSLLGHLQHLGLLRSDTAFVEFGAGRGKLSHWIQAACGEDPSIRYILVDKSNCRRKMDLYHRFESQGPRFQRLLMDIRDLELWRAEGVTESQWVVGVTKHLCGAGTDFALRCLRGVLQQCEERGEQDGCHKEPGAKRAKPHAVGLGGLVFATCCHHRCSWDSYCGRGYLEGCGLTDVDFCLITKMSSWAVCGCRLQQQEEDDQHSTLSSDEDDQVESPQSSEACQKGKPHSATSEGYSPHPKEAIGLLCKRLIDEGRVWFLRQLGLQAGLVAYVERDVSLENVLITATTAERTQQQDD